MSRFIGKGNSSANKEEFEDTKVAVNRRRTDNTMTKIKKTNGQTRNITQKNKYQMTRTPIKIGG